MNFECKIFLNGADPKNKKRLIDVDKKEESILLKNEACQSICEYAPGKMAVYARPSHLFIIHDWKVMRRIDDSDAKN